MGQLSGSTRRELVEALARLAIVLQCRPQMRSVPARFERWQEGAEGRLDVPDEALVDSRAPTELLTADVDLDDPRVRRKELLVRKVRPQHQQDVAVHHRVVAGRESEQPGHADVKRVVVLDELLAAHRMHDRGVQPPRGLDQLRMRTGAAGSAQDRDPLRVIERLGQRRDFVIGGTHARRRLWKVQARAVFDGIPERDVSRQGDHRNTAPHECGLHGDLEDAGHLLRLRHQLTVVTALREQMLRVRLLKVAAADFVARNLRGDGEHGDTTTMTVVEPVDQVEIPGTAASGADRQPPGEMRLRTSGERRGFLVSHVNPSHALVSANRVRDSVE